nr:GrpB family protein [Natronorubrum halophilum]
MVGLERGTVRLAEHSPERERLFEDEAERLRSALDDQVVAIEHVGSTAVEGLIAKPIVDILVVVDEIGSAETWSSLLEGQSYTYRSPTRFRTDTSLPRVRRQLEPAISR